MHRFFIKDLSADAGSTVDLHTISRQLSRVLRLHAGDTVILLDNCGYEYECELLRVDAIEAVGHVRNRSMARAEPSVDITLFQCALKGDKMEWVLQKGTELGVTRFVPIISERTIVRPQSAIARKFRRWETILREAAEQCGRGKVPELGEPLLWNQVVSAESAALGLTRLMPWEESLNSSSIMDAVTQAIRFEHPVEQVNLLVGPEGGITPQEAKLAQEHGWKTVTLGPRILRAETAAIASIAAVMLTLGELG